MSRHEQHYRYIFTCLHLYTCICFHLLIDIEYYQIISIMQVLSVRKRENRNLNLKPILSPGSETTACRASTKRKHGVQE